MRLLFVIARYGSVIGGTERQAAQLAAELVRRGHAVRVLTHAVPGLPARETVEGVEVVRLSPPAGGRWSSLRFALRVARHAAGEGRACDVFQAFLASAPALGLLPAARRLGRPLLVKLGASGPLGDVAASRGSAVGRVKLALLRGACDRFLCPNEEIRRELLAIGVPPERAVLLPNGVDTARFSPLPGEERTRLRAALGWEGREVALFTGRLEPQKNLGLLLDAWGGLARRRPRALLVLAGDGSLAGELAERVRREGLDASVRLAGPQDPDGVLRLLRGADAFVLPSLLEGLSNALLEAMAVGVAPAASDIPGNRELVGPLGAGLLFDPRSAAGAGRALEPLLGDPGARAAAGRAAREAVLAGYGLGRTADRYLAIVGGVVGGRASPVKSST